MPTQSILNDSLMNPKMLQDHDLFDTDKLVPINLQKIFIALTKLQKMHDLSNNKKKGLVPASQLYLPREKKIPSCEWKLTTEIYNSLSKSIQK